MTALVDMNGKQFGALTVIARGPNNRNGQAQWICRCICGRLTNSGGGNLRLGYSKSCGCIGDKEAAKRAAQRNFKHGNAIRGQFSSEYRSWAAMLKRCKYPCVNSYHRYGGRGITVCERWLEFAAFLADMGPKPTPRHTIDRRDNDLNYEPSNCRWATYKEQAQNRSYPKRKAA